MDMTPIRTAEAIHDDAYQTGYRVGWAAGSSDARFWSDAGPWLVIALVASWAAFALLVLA